MRAMPMVEPHVIPPDLDSELREIILTNDPVRRHHYVPAFYLEYFADDHGRLRVIDAERRRILPRRRAADRVCYADHFRAARAGKADTVAQLVEAYYLQMERKLEASLLPIQKRLYVRNRIEESEKSVLAEFMAMLWMRDPAMLGSVRDQQAKISKVLLKTSDRERGEWIFKEHPEIFRHMKPEQKLKCLESMKRGSDVRAVDRIHLEMTIAAVRAHALMFQRLRWKIYVNHTDTMFVTTDRPMSVLCNDKIGTPGGSLSQRFPGVLLFERWHYLALSPWTFAYASGKEGVGCQKTLPLWG